MIPHRTWRASRSKYLRTSRMYNRTRKRETSDRVHTPAEKIQRADGLRDDFRHQEKFRITKGKRTNQCMCLDYPQFDLV